MQIVWQQEGEMMDTILVQAWLTNPTEDKKYDTFVCVTIEQVFKELRYIGQDSDYKSVSVYRCIMLWEDMELNDYVGKTKGEVKP